MPKGGVDSAFRLIAEVLQSQAIFGIGSLAQLVQSICLTSRGSGVRIPQLPQTFTIRQTTDIYQSFFLLCMLFVCKHPTPHTQQKQRASARVESWEVAALLTGCGGCEDKDIYFQWYPREGFALQIPQLPQTKRSKKVSKIRHLLFLDTMAQTLFADISVRKQSWLPPHKHSLVAHEWRILCRRRESQA